MTLMYVTWDYAMSGTCGLQIQLHALNSTEGRSSQRSTSSRAGSQTGSAHTLGKRLYNCGDM